MVKSKKTKEKKEVSEKLSIKSWDIEDRPREKLDIKGPSTLSTAELIAILLRTGTAEKTSVDLAKHLMDKVNNNLNNLAKLSLKDMTKIKGIGKAKAITLIAAIELAKRINSSSNNNNKKIKDSKDAYNFFYDILYGLNHEEL